MISNIPAFKTIRETLFIRAFGLFKIPMIFFLSPRVVEFAREKAVICIPLTRRSKNHLNSMYFGALCVGADLAGGIVAMKIIRERKKNVSLVFKDFHAEFLKRAEGDVHFICEQGAEIEVLVEKTLASGQRESMPVHLVAVVPSKSGNEPVAKFVLTLSLKAQKS